jgi:carbamoyltransferase
MYILGLSALAHDSSAALVGDKGVIAAIEEGKLSRTRSASGIPHAAIRFCFERAGTRWNEMEKIAVAARFVPAWWRRSRQRFTESVPTPVSSGDYLRILRQLAGSQLAEGQSERVIELDHQLCHAAGAFYPSPFERAVIVTMDEMGDGHAGLVALGEGVNIQPLQASSFPNSLGWVYSQVTELIGFRPHQDEHKTQWLSLTGRAEFAGLFVEMLRSDRNPMPRLNKKFFNSGLEGRVAFSEEFYRRIGISEASEPLSAELRANLAASVQQACATVVTELLRSLLKKHKVSNVCLAGGLFLNPLLVESVERESGFEKVFVQLAAGNEGTALGAAWLVQHQMMGRARQPEASAPYWGPIFSNEEIKQVLDNCKATYHWMDSEPRKLDEAVKHLLAGRILAWYQGAAEFGPRALGHRSLFASPWDPYMKENLNDYVKHRESYRPFALSVPEEDCGRYFECSDLGRFMGTMARARPEAHELLGGLILPGGRVRLHIVERSANPLLWRLLKHFGTRAPAPMLVNTSFNLFGEPLVISPRDAIRSFYCSGTDAMMLGDFLLTKSTAEEMPESGMADQAERWSRA